MTEQALFVLACLARGESHGYAIAREVERSANGRVRLTAGTLYGVLGRLVDQGLIEPAGERVVEGRPRRYYRLTGAGQAALAAEVDLLSATVDAVRGLAAGTRLGLA